MGGKEKGREIVRERVSVIEKEDREGLRKGERKEERKG